jgi:hypothetical protein
MRYLTTRDLLAITDAALGPGTPIRDAGLVDSAAHRPRTTAFGQDAYPDLHTKAAAILHSILRNHPLVDGNKRLAWVSRPTPAESLVVKAALRDTHLVINDEVDNPVLVVDPPRPIAAEVVLQRLGLADTFRVAVSGDVFDECVHAL